MSEPDAIVLGRRLVAVIERDFSDMTVSERHVMLATALGISLEEANFPGDTYTAILAMGKMIGVAAGYERQLKNVLINCRGTA